MRVEVEAAAFAEGVGLDVSDDGAEFIDIWHERFPKSIFVEIDVFRKIAPRSVQSFEVRLEEASHRQDHSLEESMSRITSLVAAMLIAFTLMAATPAMARVPKKYQVTGKILEVTDDYIAVDKAGERWEVGRDANTKVTGTLKVGATVTIEYVMNATKAAVK